MEIPPEADRTLTNSSIESIITGMVTATDLYNEGRISKEDLFQVEKMIDKFPFKTSTISGREEFEKLYRRFKEYTLKVFLGEK